MSSLEYPQENGQEPAEIRILKDAEGRALSCYIEHSFTINSQEYVLLMPVDSPVEIFSWPEEEDDLEEPIPVEESEIDEIFEVAKAVLAEQNLTLKRTAIVLTVGGDLPDFEELEDEEDDLEPSEESDYEELQLLASFYNEEREYSIYTPLDPFFILARLNADGQPELLSNEELEEIEPMLPSIEGMIEERLFDGI
ncbi:MAG TPA: DUF3727 domain-containing protein [Oscillatoriaceae cyanobacterium M33_DOE_052]|uniref:DUF3727 domain-containing protein n=1 Tax=Planktothricoides sp. SpSt-374 TaxID=2282167 RepID=A0A7C3ZNM8_9CYAN|nr:DUF3727 domain-containing protein [Oscillatoriaceae cyanobacterium M33_DOE_052]